MGWNPPTCLGGTLPGSDSSLPTGVDIGRTLESRERIVDLLSEQEGADHDLHHQMSTTETRSGRTVKRPARFCPYTNIVSSCLTVDQGQTVSMGVRHGEKNRSAVILLATLYTPRGLSAPAGEQCCRGLELVYITVYEEHPH